ncbi:MAG TPA: sigma-E factor regulatory protein RseB domain-containing protein [Candidatus Eremiobacteraceae bacterium]
MARPLFALVCALLTVIVAHNPAGASPEGNTLLQRAVVADDATSYTGTLTSVVYTSDRAESTVVNIDHLAPSQWRIWYVAPADAYGRLIVSNETVTYQYEPSANKVYANNWSASALALGDALDTERVEKNYAAQVGAETSVAGRSAHILTMTSKHSGTLVERLWIDDQTNLILRREIYHADGTIASKMSFDNVRTVKTLPKELFNLSIPARMTLVPGATYATKAASDVEATSALTFTVVRPKFLPEGFALAHESLGTHDAVQTLQIVYDDGLRDFSLFENATGRIPKFDNGAPHPIAVGDQDGFYSEAGNETIVSWNAGGLNLTLVGDLPAKELSAIGASLKP